MSKSHLYTGFRFASQLASVSAQRELESTLIKGLFGKYFNASRLLSIGTAYGDELVELNRHGALKPWKEIWGIDIASDVEAVFLSQPELVSPERSLQFRHMDACELPSPFGEDFWDCIQCGFVMEDIEYLEKRAVYDRLYKSLRTGGAIVISEMFLDNRLREGTDDIDRVMCVEQLYNQFLTEAKACLNKGYLNDSEYNELVGEGKQYGLVASKNGAIRGERDSFEAQEQTEQHLSIAGFMEVKYYTNPVNKYLGVITAKKLGHI